MKRWLIFLLLAAAGCPTLAVAQQQDARFLPGIQKPAQVAADPRLAVVQIDSHGGSGTVIESGPGRTLILTAAHLFRGGNVPPEGAAMTFLVPPVPGSEFTGPRKVKMRRISVGIPGWRAARPGGMASDDVALIEVDDGPWPVVCPVAQQGFVPGKNVVRVGYPGERVQGQARQKWPALVTQVTLLGTGQEWTLTREAPIPGESGGALIDMDAGVLIGVTSWRGPVSVTNPTGGGHVPLGTIHSCLGNRQSPPRQEGSPDYGPGIRIIEDKAAGQTRRPEDGWEYDPKSGGYFRTIPRAQTPPPGPFAFGDPGCPDGNCPYRR